MKRVIIPILLLFILSLPTLAEDKYNSYSLEVTLDTENHTLEGEELVNFFNDTGAGLSELYFHLYPNAFKTSDTVIFTKDGFIPEYPNGFDSGYIDIEAVEDIVHSYELIPDIEGTVMRVPLKDTLPPNEKITLRIKFKEKIPNVRFRFGYDGGVTYLGNWYPILAVYEEGNWRLDPYYPLGDPFYSEAALYEVKINLPESEVVGTTGEIKETINRGDGIKTLHLVTSAPSRDFALVCSPHYEILEKEVRGIKIRSLYLPQHKRGGEEAWKFTKEMLMYLDSTVGQYPYAQLTIAEVPLGNGAMEYPNLIFMGNNLYSLTTSSSLIFEFIIGHEVSHQWWYNIIGNDQIREPWLDEAVASYWAMRHLEDKHGRNSQGSALRSYLERDYLGFVQNNPSIEQTTLSPVYDFKDYKTYDSLVYSKGALICDSLAFLVGDDNFNKIFNIYYQQYKFKIAHISDFIKICEEVSGEKLGWFFDEWLRTNKRCDYAIEEAHTTRSEGAFKTEVLIKQLGEIDMPVEIHFLLPKGKELIRRWEVEGKKAQIEINTISRVEMVEIDPDHRIIDIDRTNNRRSLRIHLIALISFFFNQLLLWNSPILLLFVVIALIYSWLRRRKNLTDRSFFILLLVLLVLQIIGKITIKTYGTEIGMVSYDNTYQLISSTNTYYIISVSIISLFLSSLILYKRGSNWIRGNFIFLTILVWMLLDNFFMLAPSLPKLIRLL